MLNYCGADCGNCPFSQNCKGCLATCGSPFGGRCVAAQYIRTGGKNAYEEFKKNLTDEINMILEAEGIPQASSLNELPGHYVNLVYRLPNGESVKFLDDRNVYLGTQIELPDNERCIGVIADTTFILVCSYGEGGNDPELILYRRR